MPALVVGLFHRGRPKLGLQLWEPLGSDRTGPNLPPVEVDRDPPGTRVHSHPPLARTESLLPPARAESLQPPARMESLLPPAKATNQPPQAEVGHQQLREVPLALPQVGEERVIVPGLTGTKWSCVKLVIGSLSPKGLPIRLGRQRRGEAVGRIYDKVDGKVLPLHNIASEALRAYYTRVDPQTLNTWACQMLCMIAEYHMACVTTGSLVTSPIVPRELEEHLPPLADYAPPEDQSGSTDVTVRDHRARTLWVAIWCHWLDMALSKEPASSGSLVRSQHRLRCLLAYFLGPRTTWELQFEDVVTQVLKENLRHIDKR